MDVDNAPDGSPSGPGRAGLYHVEEAGTTTSPREEDKDEEGTSETREMGLGTVVV
jgi:hypothetical protein